MEISEEALAAIADAVSHQNSIDYAETGPKAAYAQAVHLGVSLSSRYDVLAEYEAMQRALDAMPELLARRIKSVFCDSKACAAYSVVIRSGMILPVLPGAVLSAFETLGGFNWLDVEYEGESLLTETSYWPGEG